MGTLPLIAIAPDVVEPVPGSVRVQCGVAYARAVASAGGVPVYLPPVVELIASQMDEFDGFVLTGGDDPRMEEFGAATHPKATPVHPARQAYEVALIRELLSRPQIPVLGICLGMQMLALVAGGRLDQHLPDSRPDAERHRGNREHGIVGIEGERGAGARLVSAGGMVVSHHRQAVTDAGSLRVVARSDDGVVEAIEREGGALCLGVQWHPERMGDAALGAGVFVALVEAARRYRASRGRPA